MTFNNLKKNLLAFRDKRDWIQFHNPKDLAISISLEASELLECFQWSGGDTYVLDKNAEISDELADIFIYCIYMADTINVDLLQIAQDKLEKNEERYPAGMAKGISAKYTELPK